MSKTFYVVLPSNTKYPSSNRANKYTVQLPQSLEFGGQWLCGISSISYPRSYATIGTTDDQFLYVVRSDDRYRWPYELVRIPFPRGEYIHPGDIATKLNEAINQKAQELAKHPSRNRRAAVVEEDEPPIEKEDKPPQVKDEPPREEEEDEPPVDLQPKAKWKHVHTFGANEGGALKNLQLYQDRDAIIITRSGKEQKVLDQRRPPMTDDEIKRLRLRHYIRQAGDTKIHTYLLPNNEIHAVFLSKRTEQIESQEKKARVEEPKSVTEEPKEADKLINPKEVLKEAEEPEIDESMNEKVVEPKEEADEPEIEVVSVPAGREDYGLGIDLERNDLLSEEEMRELYNMSHAEYQQRVYVTWHTLLNTLKVEWVESLQRFRLVLGHTQIESVYFTPQLGYVMGYDDGDRLRGYGNRAKHAPEMSGGIHHMYVYSNITESVVVGDTVASLMRVVTISGEHGTQVEETYDNPFLIRVVNQSIISITVDIRTANGRSFPFDWGDVILVLMFKKAIYL